MTINQVQLNHIIDLLGDYVFALHFNLIKPVQEKHNGQSIFDKDYRSYLEPKDADESILDIQTAKNAYYQALSELYVDKNIPTVFTKQLRVMGAEIRSNETIEWWGRVSIERSNVIIEIAEIVKKLNIYFNLKEHIEEQANLLTYTGTRYKSYSNDTIFVGAQKSIKDSLNMPNTNFYFVMAVLSSPGMLFLAALLVYASCVSFASGLAIPGVIFAAASVSIASCNVAKRFGFFAENHGTDHSVTIEPYSMPFL